MADKKLAFVLSGGGSRGALQVGALYALHEAGIQPDLLVGVSIGAVNGAYLALHGFSQSTLDQLTAAWHSINTSGMFPTNYLWLTVRAMVGRSSSDPSRRLREFFIAHGISPELQFDELNQHKLVIVSTDLNTGQPILHGGEAEEKVLDALLLTTTVPPWFMPVHKQDRYLMDGGVVSNLPVEAALKQGATQIVALDLTDEREVLGKGDRVRLFFDRLIYSVEKRELDLELQLAEARGVPLLYIDLIGEIPVPAWDFQHTRELIARGYEIARQVIDSQRNTHPILTFDP